MEIIFILIGISLILAIGFLVAFILCVKNGQFEDSYTPSLRMLLEDKPIEKKNELIIENENFTKTQ